MNIFYIHLNDYYKITQNKFMLAFIKIVVIVYFVSINVYGFLLIYHQRKEYDECTDKKITDGKLFAAGALGGATGIYIAMFVLKYRLTNLFLMVVMPVLITINIYFLIVGFSNSFWLIENEIYH